MKVVLCLLKCLFSFDFTSCMDWILCWNLGWNQGYLYHLRTAGLVKDLLVQDEAYLKFRYCTHSTILWEAGGSIKPLWIQETHNLFYGCALCWTRWTIDHHFSSITTKWSVLSAALSLVMYWNRTAVYKFASCFCFQHSILPQGVDWAINKVFSVKGQ